LSREQTERVTYGDPGQTLDHPMAISPAPTADAEALTRALDEARERTLHLVASISDCELERVHSPLMSPLVWDLGHIAAYEDLWLVHRFAGQDMVRRDLAEVYDAFETPRAGRGDLPFLGPADARAYLAEVRERTLAATEEIGPGDGLLHELVVRHEHQHTETMLQTIQLARLDGFAPVERRPARASARGHTGLELVDVPGGRCEVGAPAAGFAYDNERPRHRVDVRPFRLGVTPVTHGTWMTFAEGGGYERREWWTDEAWHWKEEYDITHPGSWDGDGREWRVGGWEPIDPDKPVVHVSWFEADAFARAHGARLPTELEWERAATWDQETGRALPAPWGAEPWSPERANLDQLAFGTEPAGSHPEGAAPSGALGMLGDVWEWTSSRFDGYPGFTARPYREYSEVFFGADYRVLRGGSWATRARVATPTFRNWDYPQRRQIFAGLRIARNAAG
jgi:iron(II)-dependent oxidoreductase